MVCLPPFSKLKKGLYHWLPIVFGCHCRPDRSFFFRGQQFPLCARCTGVLSGMILGLVTGGAVVLPGKLLLFGSFPLLVDGFLQQLTRYESTNGKRLLTGTLFGFALMQFLILTTIPVFFNGMEMGRSFVSG